MHLKICHPILNGFLTQTNKVGSYTGSSINFYFYHAKEAAYYDLAQYVTLTYIGSL